MRSTFGIGLLALVIAAAGCEKKAPSSTGSAATTSSTTTTTTTTTTSTTAAPESLDGTYTITENDFGPMKSTPEKLAKDPEAERTVTIKGDKLTHAMMEKSETWTIKLDPSKVPHEIKVNSTRGGKSEDYSGIYKLEGSTLTVHLGLKNPTERPKSFAPSNETWLIVMTKK